MKETDTTAENSAFVRACRGLETDYTPIWLNRQAGRYMREYHEVKGDTPSLEFFKTPDLAARVTVDAQRILGVDAAIMFADLLPVLEPLGLELDYLPNIGPVFANPVRSGSDIDALTVRPAVEATPNIRETIRRIKDQLPRGIPLIGFAGAPFTLASYAIEGRGSKTYLEVKKMMYTDAGAWDALNRKLVDTVADYALLQIDAGVDAVQLFDSWVGCLDQSDYQRFVEPWMSRLLTKIKAQSPRSVPLIYFGTGNPHLVDQMYGTGPDVMALDWRTPLGTTWDRLGCRAVQGNLDPMALCADRATVERKAKEVLVEASNRVGHIFNLGHGIHQTTPVDNVKFLVDFVHEFESAHG